ncbi:hypothetical protein [Actinomadura rudentiformis]|uniref:hypothetical protein n=1 Tax=Actinomadura rudentiformis TaxID=359158 RepID=UPI00178C62C3|nr:hypothetical protein [Actinomadura rudentiformis]
MVLLLLGMLLAAALMLADGWDVSRAVQTEAAQGSDTQSTVLAEGAQGMRRPLTP